MKKLKYFLLIAMVLPAFVACSDDDEQASASAEYVFFPQDNKAYYVAQPTDNSITVQIERVDVTNAQEIGLKAEKNDGNIFKVPASVRFASGQSVADIEIGFSQPSDYKDYSLVITTDNSNGFNFVDPYNKTDRVPRMELALRRHEVIKLFYPDTNTLSYSYDEDANDNEQVKVEVKIAEATGEVRVPIKVLKNDDDAFAIPQELVIPAGQTSAVLEIGFDATGLTTGDYAFEITTEDTEIFTFTNQSGGAADNFDATLSAQLYEPYANGTFGSNFVNSYTDNSPQWSATLYRKGTTDFYKFPALYGLPTSGDLRFEWAGPPTVEITLHGYVDEVEFNGFGKGFVSGYNAAGAPIYYIVNAGAAASGYEDDAGDEYLNFVSAFTYHDGTDWKYFNWTLEYFYIAEYI